MRNRINESGYALVTVLFIITIFSILALTFAGQAFNSSKQNKVVEAKSQSVSLAEMGITYYQHAVRNAYISSRDQVNDAVTAKMNEDREQFYSIKENKNKQWMPNENDYLSFATSEMTSAINNELAAIQTKVMMNKNFPNEDDIYFQIINKNEEQFAKQEGHHVVIAFQSNGYESSKNTKPATLTATLTIEINDLQFDAGSGDGEEETTSENELKLPDFQKVKKPENVSSKCLNPNNIDNNCSSILFNNTNTINSNNNKMSNLTIFSTGALTFGGNANNMSYVQLHTDDAFTVGKNMNNVSNSIIESKGNATFEGHLKMERSELLVEGDLSIKYHLDVNSNSFVYIGGGNTTIEKQLTIDGHSKMCVRGDLTVKNHIDIGAGSNLFYFGKLDGQLKNNSVKPTQVTTEQEWNEKCGTNQQSSGTYIPSFNWGDIRQEIEYEY